VQLERAAEAFEERLGDHETVCSVGNWMWLGCMALLACYIVCIVQLLWERNGRQRCVPEEFCAGIGEVESEVYLRAVGNAGWGLKEVNVGDQRVAGMFRKRAG
jgi:hypothetical protein